MGRTFVTGTTLSNALISRRLRLLDVGDACLQHVEATLKHAVLSDGRHLRNGPDTKRAYHWVDFPLPCLITRWHKEKNMVLLLNSKWFLTKPKTKHVSLQSN